MSKETKDNDRKYFPLHYKWIELTGELSDEEFGKLMRALLDGFSSGNEPEGLPLHLTIAYRFIIDAAQRVVEHREQVASRSKLNAESRWGKSARRDETSNVDFDVDDAFDRAVKRSYKNMPTKS